jgi:hypothetical protein
MAYSLFDQGRLLHDQRLIGFARANDMTGAGRAGLAHLS